MASASLYGVVGTVQARATNPGDSDVSTADTVKAMAGLARAYAKSPAVIAVVEDATRGVGPGASDRDVARALFYWVKRNIEFKQDEETLATQLGFAWDQLDKELLLTPDALIAIRLGDCDDFSTLLATMLLEVGLTPQFVTIAADTAQPDRFSHVYVQVWLADENSWLVLDSSHGSVPGWEYDGPVTRKIEWSI